MPAFSMSARAHGPETSIAHSPAVKVEIELSPVIEVFSTPALPSSLIFAAAAIEPGLPTPRSVGS